MTTITKIEIEIVDCDKQDWTFKGFASAYGRYDRETHGMVYEDMSITGVFTDGTNSIMCASLAEADSRFPQSEINRIEEEAICRMEGLRLAECPI